MTDLTTEIYDAVGEQPITALAAAFYCEVQQTPVLRVLYPADLTHAERHLALFLVQRFGGPTTYSDERGHPRLRMRHLPFRIGQAEHDAWISCMTAAAESVPELAPFRAALSVYFADAAAFLVNNADVQAGNKAGGSVNVTLPPANPPAS